MTRKKDYFQTFCEVSKAFGTTLSKQELLSLICKSAVETMDGKAACLFLADDKREVFVPVAQHGLSQTYLHAHPMNARSVVAEVLQGKHLSIEDATTDPRLENHDIKKAEGIASILVVPVFVRNRPIGVLSLYTSEQRVFSEDEVHFLAALAEQGGMAIQNTKLLERIRQTSLLFSEFAANLNSSLDIKKILHIMTADIADAFGMKGVAVRLLNQETGTLELVASYGLSEEFLNKGPVINETLRRVLGGETVISALEDRRVYRAAMEQEGILSILCVPMRVADEVIGVMQLCSETINGFSEDMVQLATALGHQGGLAIRNASLYFMLQRDKMALEQEIWGHKSWF
ncbi:GAF domain-containing protein [Desulfomonile tiedjei]|uniref:GAF domain-containing protein n=1 Tax=Desulfomonile tiedjei (strain ATCC 49306 / DSM 6799 / DCB-1) TaxID=706587 RepID=I4CCB7_DESTA|nr:GAF domain-containing protein [Desulfomonile tiedjei]AFM27208.1 GAF domain-containing protein [Desulfomonile tiedjei DSM 6799]